MAVGFPGMHGGQLVRFETLIRHGSLRWGPGEDQDLGRLRMA